jgi:hypothetical protein
MEEKKTTISTKLYNNIMKIYSMIKLCKTENIKVNDENKLQEIYSKLLISLSVFFLSRFKYKIIEPFPEIKQTQNLIKFINYMLKILNSKFIIISNLTKEDFITITLYFFQNFDIFQILYNELKKFENENILVNFDLIYKSITPKNNYDKNDINKNDNLRDEASLKSNSAIEAYSKLNFILKNIKKQIDLFINSIYKLNEIKNEQPKPLNTLKIEEMLILSNDNLFSDFYQNIFIDSNSQILFPLLENLPQSVELFDDSYEIFIKEYSNYNLSIDIFNPDYNNRNFNIKIETVQNFFLIKVSLENLSFDLLDKYIKQLENNLNENLSQIKENNSNLINDPKVTEMLSTIADELEKFIEKNQKNIDSALNNFDDKTSDSYLEKEKNLIELFSKNSNLDNTYIHYLMCFNGVEDIFKKYKSEINKLISKDTDIINKYYDIYNNNIDIKKEK